MNNEKIKRAASILTEIYGKVGDKDNIIKCEKQVLERYGSLLSPDNIENLSWEEFIGFLDYKNNCHWKNIDLYPNLNRSVKENFEVNTRPALVNLLDEEVPIDERIGRCLKIKGLGKATITPFLLIAFPTKYGVWNSVSEWAMKTLGIWLESYDNKSEKKLSDGAVYKYINDVLRELANEMHMSLWSLDALFYYYLMEDRGKQICLDLMEGRRYSRKDISDIFSPEFEYKPGWGRTGLQGVISINLGVRKDYAIFAVTERSSDRKRQEVILDDGTFEWITQKKNKNKDTELVKRLKCEGDSKVLLFLKETVGEEDFVYCGPLEFQDEYRDEKADRRFIYRLKSWPSNERVLSEKLRSVITPLEPEGGARLNLVNPPTFTNVGGPGDRNNNSHRGVTHISNDEENKKLGNSGEELVMQFEKEKLADTGLEPEHIALNDDGAGYDIKSYEESDGKFHEIWIEVKTTRGGIKTPFFISEREYMVSKEDSQKYRLYRLFNYHPSTGAEVYVFEGSLERANPEPAKYIIRVR